MEVNIEVNMEVNIERNMPAEHAHNTYPQVLPAEHVRSTHLQNTRGRPEKRQGKRMALEFGKNSARHKTDGVQ